MDDSKVYSFMEENNMTRGICHFIYKEKSVILTDIDETNTFERSWHRTPFDIKYRNWVSQPELLIHSLEYRIERMDQLLF